MNITMKFPVRVNTDNAQDFLKSMENAIFECGQAPSGINMSLDADELEYISSAGLRALLSIKKKIAGLSVENASADVCEIFNVTGFDEFIKVNRKIKEISIEGLKKVGMGSSASVYRLSEDRVVKVYRDGFSLEHIQKEKELSKKALALGVNTMISYETVKVGSSWGAVYEFLEAKSILEWIKDDPENERFYIEKFVDFAKKNHEVVIESNEVKSFKKYFYDRIDKMVEMGIYTADDAMTARQIIYSIPDKNTFLHGDLHIGNVLYDKANGEMFLIDFPMLCKGNPIMDIVGMAWMRLAPQVLTDEQMDRLMGIDKDRLAKLWRMILCEYFETNDEKIIDELDKIYSTLECLNLSMIPTFMPGMFTDEVVAWLKDEGLEAVNYEF